MDIQSAIRAVVERHDLSGDEMTAVMETIMSGAATPAQIGGFLIGLRMKGETIEEIAAAARVMRELCTKVEAHVGRLVDTCGTGGDGAHTFNISTASALVAAAAGAKVAKHGNRSVSSKSGSADVLEAAGVNLDLTPEQVAACIEKIGVGFLFAPRHHGAMKHAIAPRREMGVRTIFNLLGPLTNPAGARNQVVGVWGKDWVAPLAEVLARLGSHHVMVVNAEDGMDEISIASPTHVAELKDGAITRYVITPEEFGIMRADVASLVVASPKQSLSLLCAALDDTPGPATDIVALNAGAAIYVAGIEPTLEQGVRKAQAVIASGAAREKFAALISFTQSFK
ncbi:MAG: anthranilate phosphoribosyltransferase [Gammaproteobacteria bacterium]|nr:anthranilate phosphoribosyltransferase [Gammaproteobacteria bacterium]